MGPTYFKHIYAYFCIFSCMFIPIFKYISTYFYIFLLICIYLVLFSCISLHIFMYISTYFYIFTTKVWHFCHRLPQKCVVLLQIATKVWYFTTVYRYLPHKCGILLQFDTKVWARNVPEKLAQTNYVPKVPDSWR